MTASPLKVRHQPQFDLRIVGRGSRCSSSDGTNALRISAALFVAHRDVLQVRVRRTEPPGAVTA